MNFKKRVNGSWIDTSYYIHKTDTDTITTLPSNLYADGNNATVGLVGNMSQTGTPTPQNPIQPSECADMSSNLVNISDTTITGGTSYPVTLSAGTYTASAMLSSFNGTGGGRIRLQYSLNGTMYYSSNVKITTDGVSIATLEIPEGATSTAVYLQTYSGTVSYNASNIMLNTGSTALPYEPYGYKIPISSASTTTPVYLGEVETTRKIKKLVLTGEEDWQTYSGANAVRYNTSPTITDGVPITKIICSHFSFGGYNATTGNAGEVTGTNSTTAFRIFLWSDITSVTAWKEWLAAQYAAGTPVCVWYVLATSTTSIVNEPIRKIGDYADTVSGISIPTTTGADSFDVQTTLKPSEVTANYHGWHEGTVKDYENGDWQPQAQALSLSNAPMLSMVMPDMSEPVIEPETTE